MTLSVLKFGIEIECLVEVKNKPKERRILQLYSTIADDLNVLLTETGEHIDIYNPEQPEDGSYMNWNIEYDKSIQKDEDADGFQIPMELYSRILQHDAEDPSWKYSIQVVLGSLEFAGKIKTNSSCGMHIHISPESGFWELEDLKKLCWSLLWFEPALEKIYPRHRRENIWAKANHADHPTFKTEPMSTIFSQVLAIKTIKALVQLMNPGEPDPDRYYAWNFTNLLDGGIGTIEFRRPPSVTEANECLPWVELAINFVKASSSISDPRRLVQTYPNQDVQNLKNFVRGVLQEGVSHRDVFGRLFSNKNGTKTVHPIRQLSAQEQHLLEEKKESKKQRNLALWKMMEAHNAE